ncbi:hypothetical protein JOM56_015192 [Amanita muscaria]
MFLSHNNLNHLHELVASLHDGMNDTTNPTTYRCCSVSITALTQAFKNLDRQADTNMVLVASPADSSKLRMISSRSIRRTPVLRRSLAMHQLKPAFRSVAQYANAQGSRYRPYPNSQFGRWRRSDGGSSEYHEGDLRRALDAALNGLDVLKNIYECRVGRWNHKNDKNASREGKVNPQTAL